MLNCIVLIGRLVRDVELKYIPSGTAVTKMTLAVERPYTNRQGKKDVDYIDVVAWRKLAEVCASNLGKGRLVAVEGQLQTRTWKDSNGNKRKTYEVVASTVRFLDWPKAEAQGSFDETDISDSDIDIPFD